MLLFISSSIWALQGTIHPQERLRYCNHLWNSLNISPDNGNICPCVRAKVWMQQLGVPRTSTSFRSNTLLRKFFRELRKGAMNPNFDAGARHKEWLEETICREPQTSRCRQVGFWSWMRPPPSGNSWSRWNKPALGAMAQHAHLCLASKMRGKPWETGYCIWCKLNYIYNIIHIVLSTVVYYTYRGMIRCNNAWLARNTWLPWLIDFYWFIFSVSFLPKYSQCSTLFLDCSGMHLPELDAPCSFSGSRRLVTVLRQGMIGMLVTKGEPKVLFSCSIFL